MFLNFKFCFKFGRRVKTMGELNTIQTIAIIALPLIFAIVLHEVAHGWVANKLGDHTARDMGRLTLNPISHISLFGTIIMPLLLFVVTSGNMVFGYAKPVPINPYNFKNPKRDMAFSALAGPGINMVMAVSFAVILRLIMPAIEISLPKDSWEWFMLPLAYMLGYGVIINVVLAVLNMLPIPPLDGSRVVYWLLPPRAAAAYYGLQPHIMKGFTYLFFIHIFLTFINLTTFSPLLYVFKALGLIINPIIQPLLHMLLGKEII
jgi:Zn-dependent protease